MTDFGDVARHLSSEWGDPSGSSPNGILAAVAAVVARLVAASVSCSFAVRGVRELAASLLLLLLASPYAVSITALAEAGGSPLSLVFPLSTIASGDLASGELAERYHYVLLVVRASSIPWVVGAPIRSLRAATCTGEGLLEGAVIVLPDYAEEVYVPSTGSYTLALAHQGAAVEAGDVLLVLVPAPLDAGSKLPPRACGWGVRYAVAGLHSRVGLSLDKGASVYAWSGRGLRRVSLGSPLTLYIYYDKSSGFRTPSAPLYSLLDNIVEALGVNTSSRNWLEVVREKLFSIDMERAGSLRVWVEESEGWIVDANLTHVLAVLPVEGSGGDASHVALGPGERFVDGGTSGFGRFYWFTLILNTDPDTGNIASIELWPGQVLERRVYLGSYIETAGLHLLFNAAYTAACVRVDVEVREAGSGALVDGRTVYYVLEPGQEVAASIYPSTVYGAAPLEAHIRVSSCSSTLVAVKLAVLEFAKSFPAMPTSFTRQGLKLLSYGIASSGYWAESRLSGRVQGGGLKYPSTFTGIALSYGGFNGVYLDYDSHSDSGVLHVDILVENNDGVKHSGYVRVRVNGYMMGERYVVVPRDSYQVARFDIPLRSILDYQEWGGGGILVIENTFDTDSVVLYVDAFIEYKYLPEVWSPTSLGSWCLRESPALKVEANFPRSISLQEGVVGIPFKASIVAGVPCVEPSPSRSLLVKLKLYKSSGYSGSIGLVAVRILVPAALAGPTPPIAAEYKTDTGYSQDLEEYLGYAMNLYYIVSTGLGIVSLLTAVPGWIADTVFITGSVLEIVRAGLGGGYAEYKGTVLVNGAEYHVFEYSWSPGLAKPSRLELLLVKPLGGQLEEGRHTVYIELVYYENEVWFLQRLPVSIDVREIGSSHVEPYGFYGRSDVGYS